MYMQLWLALNTVPIYDRQRAFARMAVLSALRHAYVPALFSSLDIHDSFNCSIRKQRRCQLTFLQTDNHFTHILMCYLCSTGNLGSASVDGAMLL